MVQESVKARRQPLSMGRSCRDDALLTLVCSEPVEGFCFPDVEQCVYVDGPEAATVIVLAESDKATSIWPSYSLKVTWQVRVPNTSFAPAVHVECQDQTYG